MEIFLHYILQLSFNYCYTYNDRWTLFVRQY